MQNLSSTEGLLPLCQRPRSTYVRWIGIYLLGISLALLLFSIWQLKYGTGTADFSFILMVPFALGLLSSRKWAIWGTGIIGSLSTALCFWIAVMHSVSTGSGLTVSVGPFAFTEPSVIGLWMLTLVHVCFFGIPMMSVLTKLPDPPGVE